jgi:Raf kinase inhibitor-like YbhB/YbcL family protein
MLLLPQRIPSQRHYAIVKNVEGVPSIYTIPAPSTTANPAQEYHFPMYRFFILLTSLSLATLTFAQQGSLMKFETSAFAPGQPIPQKFTCQGDDVSPALSWSGAPANTKSFALIADDPDAPVGTWVHWVFYNLPAQTHSLPEGVPKSDHAQNAVQGTNDFKKMGYGGPCPPPGKPHRYFFKLYALDATLNLPPGATKADIEHAMQGHILAHAELIGTYQRK